MTPAISDRDRILVAPLARSGPRLGEIVEYDNGDGVKVHRIVARRRDRSGFVVLVHGDNTDEQPEPVRVSRLVGRVVAVEKNGVIQRLDTWRARVTAIGAVLTRRLRRTERSE